MADFMKRFDGETHALLRIVTGLLFSFHGTQKLFSWPLEAHSGTPAFVTFVAGPIELVGGLMVAVGLYTRWAAFICSGLMAAAYWMAHGLNDFFPLNNGGELAALYCFLFLFISANGPGMWSVDGQRQAA